MKILIIFLLIFSVFKAQSLEKEYFSIKDGLPDLNIKQIGQDKFGYIWVRTNTSVSRFNGKTFKRIKNLEYFLFSKLYFLKEYVYVKHNSKLYRYKSKINFNSSIHRDSNFVINADNIIDGEDKKSFYISRNDSVFRYIEYENKKKFIIKTANINTIYKDREDIYYSNNEGTFLNHKRLSIVKANRIRKIENRLIASTNNILMDLNNNEILYKGTNPRFLSKNFVIAHKKNEITLKTKDNKIFTEKIDAEINDIFFDKEETLFIGTKKGLYHLPDLDNYHYEEFSHVTSTDRKDNRIYFIYKHSAVFSFNTNNLKFTRQKIKQPDQHYFKIINFNNDLYLLGKNKLYKNFKLIRNIQDYPTLFSTDKALYLYNYEKKENQLITGEKNTKLENLFRTNKVAEIIEYQFELEFKTNDQLYVYHKKTDSLMKLTKPKEHIFSYHDQEKEFGFTKQQIFVKSKNNTFKLDKKNVFIPEIIGKAIKHEDSYLFSTNEGLFEYKSGKFFKRFCQLNGLVHQSTLKEVENFYIIKNKLFYFGQSGFSYLLLDSLAKKDLSFDINLSVDNQEIGFDKYIPYKHKLFKFQYDLITQRYKRDVKYFYRLSPIENEWHYTKENLVHYSKLPNGPYNFEIRAIDSEQNEYYQSFPFFVSKPFWLEWWSISIISFIVILIVYLAIQRYSGKLVKEKEQLSELVNERTAYLKDSNRLLQELNEELIDALLKRELLNKQLNDKITQMDDLLIVLNHDLIGPLRNILGMSTLLRKHIENNDDKEKVFKKLERIEANISTEMEIINDILELSKYKSVRYSVTDIDCNEIIKEIKKLFEYDIQKKNVDIIVSSPLPIIQGERIRITQVFQNLIDNAIKYMKEKPFNQIIINYSLTNEEHLFSIKDTGIGIPQDQIGRIFYAFRRVKNSYVAQTDGKGIGLSAVNSIIENYNGRIWVESIVDEGTTFYFTLSDLKNEHKGFDDK